MRVPVFNGLAVLLVCVQLIVTIAQRDIYDPRNIFCGKVSCYDVLNDTRKAPPRDIKRAYRRLSLENHPDKNSAVNATKVFKRIAKAYEVLMNKLEDLQLNAIADIRLRDGKGMIKVNLHDL